MEVKKGHPKGLYVLFFSEMWERFSYYGMRALLVLYMVDKFKFTDEAAYAVYGSYTALVYATPIFGGLLADRLLGNRKAVTLGAVLMALGHFAMAIENQTFFYLALALLICGNGFFKPNISTVVGRLYDEGDPRRDSGFTIFYMGINLGAGIAPLVCGFLGEKYGWSYGFGLAGFGMVAGLIVFLWGQRLLGGVAEPPDVDKLRKPVFAGLSREHAIYLGSAVAVAIAWLLVQRNTLVGQLLLVVGGVVFAGLIYFMVARSTKEERDEMLVALVLISFSMVFWAFFEQAGSSINLFTERNVDRTVFGHQIPTSMFQSVNPAFILSFAPIFSWLWVKLAKVGHEPRTPTKFALGVIQLAAGFGILWFGAVSAKDTGHVWIGFLVLGYLLHTTGELCLSPIGLSMITKLSPARIVGVMMGTWFLATAFSQYVASIIAALTGVHGEGAAAGAVPPPTETVMIYGRVFGQIALFALAVGIVALLVAPFLKKRMHGVH